MKRSLLVLLVLLYAAAPSANAAFYQWTDAKGVVHLTDDRKKIPKRFQSKAKRVKVLDERASDKRGTPAPAPAPAPARAPAPAPATVPQTQRQALESELTPGGHTEMWWRQRFATLRGELRALQDGVAQKQVRLVELRRERRIFTRARDREAVNLLADEISADEVQINQLMNRIDDLEQQATRAAVPMEWRR